MIMEALAGRFNTQIKGKLDVPCPASHDISRKFAKAF